MQCRQLYWRRDSSFTRGINGLCGLLPSVKDQTGCTFLPTYLTHGIFNWAFVFGVGPNGRRSIQGELRTQSFLRKCALRMGMHVIRPRDFKETTSWLGRKSSENAETDHQSNMNEVVVILCNHWLPLIAVSLVISTSMQTAYSLVS